MPSVDSLIDGTQLKKEFLNLRYVSRNFQNWKAKWKKAEKTEQTIQELWDSYKRCNTYMIRIPEG